jgi:hypothetical protein
MTFEEIRRLDAGARSGPAFANVHVPAFEEASDLARGRICVYIDAKSLGTAVSGS